MKLGRAFFSQPKALVTAEAVVVVFIIGWLDYLTEWDMSFFVFYGFPIFLIAWLGHRGAAVGVAMTCALIWYLANLTTQPYQTHEAYLWASANRAVYFVFVAIGGAAMRAQRDESKAKIEAMSRARELEQEIVRVSEHEQLRIGRDLHDGLCQNLAAIDCAAACLKADLALRESPEVAMASTIQKMVRDAVNEARNLARGIFPVQMDAGGLSAALHELACNANQLRQAQVSFEAHGDIRIPDVQVAMHLYRIAQEALSNAMRHARPSAITINLRQEGSLFSMAIADDGCGFAEIPGTSEGMGLRTMVYRAQMIGAELVVASEPRGGTVLTCSLDVSAMDAPCAAAEAV